MERLSLSLLVACWCAGVGFAQLPAREELLAAPKNAEEQKLPAFSELDVQTVKNQLHVISSRNSAVFGFNSPEVQLHLPHADNNVYAQVEFGQVSLVDTVGSPVAYERERGLYDHDGSFHELRFAAPEGSRGPVELARASGTITLRYPVRMTTISITPGSTAPEGLAFGIDGPYVTWSDPDSRIPEAASFTPISAIRALDAKGSLLQAHPSRAFSMKNGVRTETMAFWGEIAELQVDTVEQWAEFSIHYELPQAPKLPPSRAGSPLPPPGQIEDTPGGVVTISVAGEHLETGDASTPAVSEQEALARLKPLGIRHVDGGALVMSAMRGKREAVAILLSAGVPIESKHMGMTPLLAAAMYGQPGVGIQLVEAGADVNAHDETGSTPLLRAAMKCAASALVESLINAGADVNASAAGGGTALMMAEAIGCTENVALLRAAGAR